MTQQLTRPTCLALEAKQAAEAHAEDNLVELPGKRGHDERELIAGPAEAVLPRYVHLAPVVRSLPTVEPLAHERLVAFPSDVRHLLGRLPL